ncbi:MotA/TolQ/ExbB proton channel family protein [Marinibactrum halimedae]|uniref:Flagellar motor protein MotA n=1 Tax=Marinibactrum halimedae TaxID=1444977 RepID=A0AA37T4X5_9GAMM|nr:MotA/TolQ/ExbB proton channel family protein [Marinibactrum halimedae]MCD9458774.1 MotA/TolQ/ExbB proton channel family protein [Marinibactrum halimedae]GLS25333.1 flagellar motor protein MotA [Marinibactrum halimedae]
MKLTFAKKLLAFTAAGLIASSAVAQDKATSLDQLLQMVKDSKVSESADHRKREAEFKRQKANQRQLLDQAKNTKVAEEARSEKLEKTYEEQEVLVSAKRAQLQERLGSLQELFGHLTSTAGDLRTNIDNSIVSAQYPNRGDFLDELIDKMNSNTKLPNIEEIERLWYELQRETIEGGKVVKFNGVVAKPDGEQSTQEVVRIGTWNLVSDGKYLTYSADSGNMSELTRQPAGEFLSAMSELQAASSGFVKVGIDPTGPSGGSFLAALINSPDLVERWHQGGTVGYIITGVGVFAMLLGLFRMIVLSAVSAKVSAQLRATSPNTNNPLGRVLKVADDNKGLDGESLELKLEEAVLKEKPSIESGLNLLKIISAVAPLLGLLGTVTGMIVTFQAITIFGAGDPKAMAGGISGALVTTVLGLVVAIPTVLMHTLVNGRAKRVLHILDEQSAGIIAENAERK